MINSTLRASLLENEVPVDGRKLQSPFVKNRQQISVVPVTKTRARVPRGGINKQIPDFNSYRSMTPEQEKENRLALQKMDQQEQRNNLEMQLAIQEAAGKQGSYRAPQYKPPVSLVS